MKRILFLLLIAFAFSPAVETSRSQSSAPTQDTRINLSGIWEDAGDQVTITDSRGSVTARYSNQKQCRHDGSVTPYTSGFIVSGTGSTLRGTGTICYYGPKKEPVEPPATPDNSPRGVKQDSQVTIKVAADGNTLEGTQVGYHGPISFTLKRKCKPDSGRLCTALANASQLATRAISSTTPASPASYAALQQSLSNQLSQARNELCDNPDALTKLDEIQAELDSLNYQSGSSNLPNNLRLARIEKGLDDLTSTSCAGSSPPPGVCPAGKKKIEPSDEEAKNQVVDGLKAAIDELKSTAKSIEGQGGAAAQRIEGIKKRIATYEKIKGFWENIKAGSCVPSDVYQTINQVANDHRSDGYSNNCPALCKAAGDWFGRLNPGPQGAAQKKFFTDTCAAYCN